LNRTLALTAVSLCVTAWADDVSPARSKPVQTYEIVQSYKTAEQRNGGSSGMSNGRNTLIERVIAIRKDGSELEFDMPPGASAAERARTWQFPVRVFKPATGPLQLLNKGELETRVDQWLKAAGMTRAACGRWTFTWTAFRIECDPESVLATLQLLDLRSSELSDGAFYRVPGAKGVGQLTATAGSSGGVTFTANVELDPNEFRLGQAESDVVVGEISQRPVSLESALKQRSSESASGTITVAIETDSRGQALRRTTITRIEIRGQDGGREERTMTEVVERRLLR
jgi:hypothetical protein